MTPSPSLHDAFVALIGQHQRLIQKVAGMYATDAEDRRDLASEIVLQLWRAFPRYREGAKESTWLYRVALNTAISRQRAERRRPVTVGGEALLPDVPDTPAGDDPTGPLRQLISRLPPLEQALVLLHLEDRSHAEIGAILGISASNVGTRLARIRDKLRRQSAALR